MTDIEFYELRYSGRPAAFLRGFRALYLGVFFNVMIMAVGHAGGDQDRRRHARARRRCTTMLVAGAVTVVYQHAGRADAAC